MQTNSLLALTHLRWPSGDSRTLTVGPSAVSSERQVRDFRDLKVWEKAYALTLAAYRATAAFPGDEQFGLTSQIRRSAASVPANIAEGCGRDGESELARFCRIALGSASELECHLMLARDLSFLELRDYARLASDVCEVKRMLTSFVQKLRADS